VRASVTRSAATPLRQFIIPTNDRGALLSGHCDRLDQTRIIVFDVADPCAHRPVRHLLRGVGREHRFQARRIGRLLTEPSRPALRAQDYQHPVVQLGTQLVCPVMMIAKLRTLSPADERHVFQSPVSAIRQ
jgi:hypothetical protein